MPGFAEALAGVERWLLPAACLLCESPVPARQGDALARRDVEADVDGQVGERDGGLSVQQGRPARGR